MKIIMWILGIVAPYIVAFGLDTMFSGLERSVSGNFTFIALLAGKDFLIFFAVVLLSCIIIPAPKKYAAAASCILNMVIILGIIIIVYGVFPEGHSKPAPAVIFADAMGSVAGLITGAFAGYKLFQNNGWEPEELDITAKAI
ncbi:hypothetical protein [Mucilaginibacter pedocola]|uniref:Uncharacterized protein n=1 Tax=Mucilaginibacter pedocola TaxID=1792845 RepID=A0A1S9P697_9SPHI|nr:hypothetical protein [Mucilaginibacter pedocola]OOQ56483.1 hypothetical protein BC343_18740 [Mucilaginibacter pedocola]